MSAELPGWASELAEEGSSDMCLLGRSPSSRVTRAEEEEVSAEQGHNQWHAGFTWDAAAEPSSHFLSAKAAHGQLGQENQEVSQARAPLKKFSCLLVCLFLTGTVN